MRIQKQLAASSFLAIGALCTLGIGSGSAQTTSATPPEVRVSEPVTVTVWNRPLIVLRASIGGITPQDRAARIRERVESLPTDSTSPAILANPATLGGLSGLLVTVDNNIVCGIFPEDLDPESQETLDEVGRETVRRLAEILGARREQQRPGLLLRGAALVLAATAALFLFGFVVLRLRRLVLRLPAK